MFFHGGIENIPSRGIGNIPTGGGEENIPTGRNMKYKIFLQRDKKIFLHGDKKIFLQVGIKNIPPGGNMKYSSNRNMKYTFSSFLSQVGGHRGGDGTSAILCICLYSLLVKKIR